MNIPFVRPSFLANDDSSSVDVWIHAWEKSEEYFKKKFDISILLEPTSPLRNSNDIEKTIDVLIRGHYKSVLTLSRTPAHFTPEKTLLINSNSEVNFYHKDGNL
jgi:CMP-N-acetylneuraminic acid synthetase